MLYFTLWPLLDHKLVQFTNLSLSPLRLRLPPHPFLALHYELCLPARLPLTPSPSGRNPLRPDEQQTLQAVNVLTLSAIISVDGEDGGTERGRRRPRSGGRHLLRSSSPIFLRLPPSLPPSLLPLV